MTDPTHLPGERPSVSVVVPAHQEEAVLPRCLNALTTDAAPGELDIVVVANACTDHTAQVAARDGVLVLETAIAGKANALRLGDAECRAFPRVYLDADVELTVRSLRALVSASATPGVLACAPVPRWDLTGAGWVARRVHKVHDLLMAPHRALAGVGVYLLTEAGHARAFPLPDVLSDDGWVHRCFTPTERTVVAEAHSVVRPARTVRAHLRRRVRVRLGNQQLAALGHPAPEGKLGLRSMASLLRGGTASPLDAGCYLAVVLADRVLTRWRGSVSPWPNWATDGSSR